LTVVAIFALAGSSLAANAALVNAALADAADMTGIIDPQKVLFQHPQFDAIAKRVTEASRQKGNEIWFALEKETDPEKKAGILKAANQDMAEIEGHLMAPIYKDCEDALTAVMKKRKLTIVLKKDSVYFGGTDITEDVIAQMKAASGK
jgi:outer membrane protein